MSLYLYRYSRAGRARTDHSRRSPANPNRPRFRWPVHLTSLAEPTIWSVSRLPQHPQLIFWEHFTRSLLVYGPKGYFKKLITEKVLVNTNQEPHGLPAGASAVPLFFVDRSQIISKLIKLFLNTPFKNTEAKSQLVTVAWNRSLRPLNLTCLCSSLAWSVKHWIMSKRYRPLHNFFSSIYICLIV